MSYLHHFQTQEPLGAGGGGLPVRGRRPDGHHRAVNVLVAARAERFVIAG